MIKEIMLVPFPLAASRRLMSFFTFHISIYKTTSRKMSARKTFEDMIDREKGGFCKRQPTQQGKTWNNYIVEYHPYVLLSLISLRFAHLDRIPLLGRSQTVKATKLKRKPSFPRGTEEDSFQI